ncbi:MAG: hypothetical protein HN509_15545 [Halobacteriovoraceae bacterium]|jgi:hypothetical protein|nr:hypothetical protein [Halobacteriovoraceae bacterium]MBT5092697.1 hypothetical protein [Halobacteriovoraceae bacterium]
MKKLILMALLSSNIAIAAPSADIAILLDTSGSMQGLINQVRDGLWQTLNNLGEIKKDGEVAELKLALFEYGSGIVPAEANFMQMLSPLTTDHTVIAEKLFATKASGSQEYSGQAIQLAADSLDFSSLLDDFKSIVIAGNETIKQGSVDALEAALAAKEQDILVNTIFAGAQTIQVFPNGGGTWGGGFGCRTRFCPTPIPAPVPAPAPAPAPEPEFKPNTIYLEWKELAKVGGGESLNIDANNAVKHIESPFDDKIILLTEEVNKTYLPYGATGASEYTRMLTLDRQIRSSGNGSYMGWGGYRDGNFGAHTQLNWDLVTASEDPNFDLSAISEEHLPEQLKGKTLAEKKALIKVQSEKRKALKEEIADLQKKRKVYVAEQRQQQNQEEEKDFAAAFHQIILKQLAAKGFQVKTAE